MKTKHVDEYIAMGVTMVRACGWFGREQRTVYNLHSLFHFAKEGWSLEDAGVFAANISARIVVDMKNNK